MELLATRGDGRHPCPDVSGLVTANNQSGALLAACGTELVDHAITFRPNLGQPPGVLVGVSRSSHDVGESANRRPSDARFRNCDRRRGYRADLAILGVTAALPCNFFRQLAAFRRVEAVDALINPKALELGQRHSGDRDQRRRQRFQSWKRRDRGFLCQWREFMDAKSPAGRNSPRRPTSTRSNIRRRAACRPDARTAARSEA